MGKEWLNLKFIYFVFHFENLSSFFFIQNKEVVRGIEPQTNTYKPNYQTTTPTMDELTEIRF